MQAPLIRTRSHTPAISVIICTYNRKNLIGLNLQSLVGQKLDKYHFEVIVVDDGSEDGSEQLVDSFAGRLPVRYFYQRNAGLSSARNHGIFAARGKIVFFFDDDDIASPTLLDEHLRMHRLHPGENFAVLNRTAWHPGLEVTPLMHYITEVGCFLFAYPLLQHGAISDYTFFWGGRVSCKRTLLLKHGVFRPQIKIHYEDIELGYRLAKKCGLKVVYNELAVSHMARPVSFDEFCLRMMMQGRSAYHFAKMHPCSEVQRYCGTADAAGRWRKMAPSFYAKVRAARELDKFATLKSRLEGGLDDSTRRMLHSSYNWVFRACKLKGIIEAHQADDSAGRAL